MRERKKRERWWWEGEKWREKEEREKEERGERKKEESNERGGRERLEGEDREIKKNIYVIFLFLPNKWIRILNGNKGFNMVEWVKGR